MFAKETFSGLRYLFVTLVAIAFLVATVPVEEAAAGSSELKKVIQGAKKEGVLKIQWTAGRLDGEAGLRKIVAAINKRYGTNIKLRFTPGPNFPKMLNKITQEKAAGLPSSTDVNLMTSSHATRGAKIGLLRKWDWEKILERPAPSGANVQRIATGGHSVMIASRIVGITYNTNLVKGDDIPVSMEDVFKPKWKGKIASTPFATGLYQFAAKDMLGYERMKNYTQRLAKHIGGLFTCASVDRISSGEFAMMVFDCGNDDALRYQRRGAPVGHTTIKEIARINHLYLGVPVHAKHPNTAALLINFLNTREGQALQWEVGRHDLHIYPDAHNREPVQKVLAKGGKLFLDTVERALKLGTKDIRRIQKEFRKMLKEGGR